MKEKQPRLLYGFIGAQIWERYAYYTIGTLLVLYLTTQQNFSNNSAYQLYGAFTALLFLTPLIGGYLADNLIGYSNAAILGSIILCAGYCLLAVLPVQLIHYSLALIIIGSGLYMPNIASIIGELYHHNDARREGGFSIFYAGINIGAFLPPIITPFLIKFTSWETTLFIASLSLIFNLAILFYVRYKQPQLGKKQSSSSIKKPIPTCTAIIFGLFMLCAASLLYPNTTNELVIVLGSLFVAYVIVKIMSLPSPQSRPLLICLLLTVASIVFWMLHEQAGSSMTMFVNYNVNRVYGNHTIPVQYFRSLNPLFVIILAPLLSKLWIYLEQHNLNPSISAKFAFGIMLMGLGYITIALVTQNSNSGQISLNWIVFSYLLQTLGELLISPIGLSMVTSFSPKHMVGLIMGVWYFATAVADALASFISQWTTVESGSNNPLLTYHSYAHVFSTTGTLALITGLLLLLASRKLMAYLNSRSN